MHSMAAHHYERSVFLLQFNRSMVQLSQAHPGQESRLKMEIVICVHVAIFWLTRKVSELFVISVMTEMFS
jgi:hypothetical protein